MRGKWKKILPPAFAGGNIFFISINLFVVRFHLRRARGFDQGMIASGDDEFFWTGSGSFYTRYTVEGLDAPKIEPVAGCQISVPLPDGAMRFVRLPGMASFDSKARPDEMKAFYQERLPKDGWKEAEPPSQSSKALTLSYQRGAEKVEITIETPASGSGSSVKLIFISDK
jgi:hypothetical protein